MSRRFGRNQKRRMRAEIEAAQSGMAAAQSETQRARDRASQAAVDVQRHEELLAHLIGILNAEDPALLAFSGKPIQRVNYDRYTQQIGVRCDGEFKMVRLATLACAIERHAFALESAVHFRISTSTDDFVSSYRICEETLRRNGLRRDAFEAAAESVARRIVDHCVEQVRGAARR